MGYNGLIRSLPLSPVVDSSRRIPRSDGLSRFLVSSLIAIAAWVADTSPAFSQLFARYEVANAVFSPDGDEIEDTTNVNITLSSAATISVVVFEVDSITPVDTLFAEQPAPQGRTDLGWDGLRWNGVPAADGAYLVTITSGAPWDTSATRQLYVDTGAPSIAINSVTPTPYAPGLTGNPSEVSIALTVSGASPAYLGIPRDEVQYDFLKPGDVEIVPDTIRFEPEYKGDDGVFELLWNAENQPGLADGEYRVTLTIVDQAGHSAYSDHTFLVDAKAPEMKITSPKSGISFQQAPDSLFGWARDLTSIDTLAVRFTDNGAFSSVAVTRVSADTTFFTVPLADSLADEGAYKVTVRAVDGVGREGTASVNLTVDRTAPDPPELDPFAGSWHTSTFRVTGTFPSGSTAASRVLIYRNGIKADSVFTLTIERIDRTIPLEAGENVITATFVDGAGNESAPSNAVTVTFDDRSGLYVEAPMRPGDVFNVNVPQAARWVIVHVYDMTGDLVVVLEEFDETTSYSLPWDGRNGSGNEVKKGPFVAVAKVLLTNGETTSFRELFLFDPDPE
jgi:hypothetical protein